MSNKGQLSHVEIYVSDLKLSTIFWKWFLEELGYNQFQKWEDGISWKLGNTYIVFVQTVKKHNQTKYNRCQTGLNHLAFISDSKLDVDKMYKKLIEKNIPILYEDRFPNAGGNNTYAIFFEDPDGIKVEYTFNNFD